jgi:predicted phosphodiesterase
VVNIVRPLVSLLTSALVLVGAGCLDAASERVQRDEAVGKAALPGGAIAVAGGLASVRSVAPGEVVLWGQAPAIDLTLSFEEGAPNVWKIHLWNSLPDTEITVTGGAGRLVGSPGRTRRTFEVSRGGSRQVGVRLAPGDAEQGGSFRFGVLSDVQEAIDGVGEIYRKINETPGVRFVLGIGDLTEQGTREELERFQRELEALEVPYFATLGNHELGTDPPPFHELFGRGNFHFRYRGVHFTLLDSASASLDRQVYGWLDGWLEEGKGATHVVGMHIPPVDPVGVRNGSFASRAEASKLIGRLAEGGVDLSLYGHIHTYQPFSNGGIPAYISGGGGSIPERLDGIGRHFMVVDVNGGAVEQVGMVPVDR